MGCISLECKPLISKKKGISRGTTEVAAQFLSVTNISQISFKLFLCHKKKMLKKCCTRVHLYRDSQR